MHKPTLGEISLRVRNRLAGRPAIPRPRYITNVAGAPDVGHYLRSGTDSLQAIPEMLAGNGLNPCELGDVLDFGCGCGRILRHWERSDDLRLHGTDYNPHLVAWCRRNYGFADFRVNDLEGPLPYPDGSFDLVYAWSVFTHLSVEIGDRWIAELARALRPRRFSTRRFTASSTGRRCHPRSSTHFKPARSASAAARSRARTRAPSSTAGPLSKRSLAACSM